MSLVHFPHILEILSLLFPVPTKSFPPSETQASWHKHVSGTFWRYSLHCFPYPRSFPSQIQNTDTIAPAHSSIFSKYSPHSPPNREIPPHLKRRHHGTRTYRAYISEIVFLSCPAPTKSFAPHPKRRHHGTGASPQYSRDIRHCLPYPGNLSTHLHDADMTAPASFPQYSETYYLYSLAHRRNLPHIPNAGIRAPVHFPHSLTIFSSLFPVPTIFSSPHQKSRRHDTGTFPTHSRDILLIVSRTYEHFPPKSTKQAP